MVAHFLDLLTESLQYCQEHTWDRRGKLEIRDGTDPSFNLLQETFQKLIFKIDNLQFLDWKSLNSKYVYKVQSKSFIINLY